MMKSTLTAVAAALALSGCAQTAYNVLDAVTGTDRGQPRYQNPPVYTQSEPVMQDGIVYAPNGEIYLPDDPSTTVSYDMNGGLGGAVYDPSAVAAASVGAGTPVTSQPVVTQPAPMQTYQTAAVGGAPSGFTVGGTSWRVNGVSADLHFDARTGAFGGQGPCNLFGGSFAEGAGGTLALTDIFATERACGALQAEQAFLTALRSVTGYSVDPAASMLTLTNAAGAPVVSAAAF